MKHRVMEILMMKFNEFRERPNLQQRIRFDRISPQLLRFFTSEPVMDDDENVVTPRTISFEEIWRVYPNAKIIMFVNRHLDENGHNVSCLNERVIESLIGDVAEDRALR